MSEIAKAITFIRPAQFGHESASSLSERRIRLAPSSSLRRPRHFLRGAESTSPSSSSSSADPRRSHSPD